MRKVVKRKEAKRGLVAILVVLAVMLSTLPGLAQSGPNTMNYQGRLLDSSGNPRSAETHCMMFRMCTDGSNENTCTSTQKWPSSGYELHEVTTESGTYKAGLFTVTLGDSASYTDYPIPPTLMYDHDTLYLEINVSDSSSNCTTSSYHWMAPRSQLRTSPYAQRSRRVRTQESDNAYLVDVENSGQGGGIHAETNSTSTNGTAGYFQANGASGGTNGLWVENKSTGAGATAGYFQALGSSGATYGIYATNDSTSDNARAGSFLADGDSGETYGVYARNDSTGNDATAGYFYAASFSGQTYGVYAKNTSTSSGARAGHFYAVGISGEVYGLYARSDSSSGHGAHVVNLHTDTAADQVGLWVGTYHNHIMEGHDLNSDGSSANRRMYLTTSGDMYIDGTYYDTGADFAEMLPAVDGLEPGDVLAVGPDGQLVRSSKAYDGAVVGVYSTKPAFVGGSDEARENPGKVPLAVVGIVPVKASTENGPIRPGDLLVASSIHGHAMRAGDDPPQGTVIGKALESLERGKGLIQMLATLQ